MHPKFPDFKILTIEDKELVESFTDKIPPYSDFNFTNLWAWNIDGGRKISILNNNLVILFTDYRTTEPTFSFLGENMIDETAETLLAYTKDYGVEPQLNFVPEALAINLESQKLNIREDITNHDYIFSVAEIANPQNNDLKTKCRLANCFLEKNPDAYFTIQKLQNDTLREQIFSVLHCWGENKKAKDKEYEIENEELAIKRLLETAGEHRLMLSGVYLDKQMIGFSIDELLPNNYALSHFIKADINYKGIYEFLNQQVAGYLEQQGVKYWNWEQDLNIEGLKQLKLSYRPSHYLKKYIITTEIWAGFLWL